MCNCVRANERARARDILVLMCVVRFPTCRVLYAHVIFSWQFGLDAYNILVMVSKVRAMHREKPDRQDEDIKESLIALMMSAGLALPAPAPAPGALPPASYALALPLAPVPCSSLCRYRQQPFPAAPMPAKRQGVAI